MELLDINLLICGFVVLHRSRFLDPRAWSPMLAFLQEGRSLRCRKVVAHSALILILEVSLYFPAIPQLALNLASLRAGTNLMHRHWSSFKMLQPPSSALGWSNASVIGPQIATGNQRTLLTSTCLTRPPTWLAKKCSLTRFSKYTLPNLHSPSMIRETLLQAWGSQHFFPVFPKLPSNCGRQKQPEIAKGAF